MTPYVAQATDPPSTSNPDICTTPNNRIVGPRTQNRPLPLMSGDVVHGFKPACSVPWSVLNPKNEPLTIEACYRGNLLQTANDEACGAGKGKLWISARWVVTSADLLRDKDRVVA